MQLQFLAAHAETGISPQAWCEARGLNYTSARRYIKKPAQKAEKKTAQTAQDKVRKTAQISPAQHIEEIQPSSPEYYISEFGLNPNQARFVYEYLRDRNKTAAYIRAGYKCDGLAGESAARRLYRHVAVNRAIVAAERAQLRRLEMDADEVLRHYIEIATADANELTQLRRVNCRHCWGSDNAYQWKDEEEFFKAEQNAEALREGGQKNVTQPRDIGGYGFVSNDDPNPDCPKCHGEGIEEVFINDTRDLSGPARRLYAGVKQTKNGIEILTRDQDAALKVLAQRFKLVPDANNPPSKDAPPPPADGFKIEFIGMPKKKSEDKPDGDPA